MIDVSKKSRNSITLTGTNPKTMSCMRFSDSKVSCPSIYFSLVSNNDRLFIIRSSVELWLAKSSVEQYPVSLERHNLRAPPMEPRKSEILRNSIDFLVMNCKQRNSSLSLFIIANQDVRVML